MRELSLFEDRPDLVLVAEVNLVEVAEQPPDPLHPGTEQGQ